MILYHGILWYIGLYHGILWYSVMVYYGSVPRDIIILYHDTVSQYTIVMYHGI